MPFLLQFQFQVKDQSVEAAEKVLKLLVFDEHEVKG